MLIFRRDKRIKKKLQQSKKYVKIKESNIKEEVQSGKDKSAQWQHYIGSCRESEEIGIRCSKAGIGQHIMAVTEACVLKQHGEERKRSEAQNNNYNRQQTIRA